jgi:O-antigen/teichoic acid export membrane protein
MSINQAWAAPGAHAFQPGQDLLFFRVIAGRTAGTVLLRISSLGLTFLLSIVLANALGAAGYGIYVLCMTWATLLSTLATLGLPSVAVRETARARATNDHRTIRSLAVFTYSIAVVGGCCAAAAVAALVFLARSLGIGELWHGALVIVALSIPLACVAEVTGALQSGYERILSAQIPEMVFRPSALLALLIGAWLTGAWLLDVNQALALYLVSAGASLLLALTLAHALLGWWEWPHPIVVPRSQDWRAWLRAGVVLMANQLLLNAMPQIDILMLGWLAGTGEVGVYHAASRGALLITLAFGAMNAAAAPTVARLWGGGHLAELQKLLTSCARTTFSVAVLVGAALLLGAKAFLGWLGPEFVRGELAMAILLVGWLGVVACGPSLILLIMTGFERAALTAVGAGVMGNVAFNALLIPAAGVTGAAAATSISVVFYHLALCRAAYRLTGIQTHCLASSNSATTTS